MILPRTLVVTALGALALGTVATGANAGHGGYDSTGDDPDGAGPEFARLRDLNGDGRNDSCFQSSYQQKGTVGDFEYHARVNNTGMAGEQQVEWGMDQDRDGRINSRDSDDIKIDWSADGTSSSDRSYSR